jgi:hypothetical protein
MSGYLYPYTPYPTAGNLQSSGQAFLGGFGAGQEIESRAQEMDAKNQLQKLRQVEEERQRQAFPLRMQQAEQQLKFAAQNQPLTLEKLRMSNQLTQAQIDQLRTAISERAALGASLRGMTLAPLAVEGTTPNVAPRPPGVTVPGATPGYIPMDVPAAPGSGPQASLDLGVQRFGDRDFNRRFSGVQVASGGVNDATGLPAGVTPEMLEPDYQRYPQTGFPGVQEGPSPTAPEALPAGLRPPTAPAAAAPGPVATDPYTDPFYANIPVGTVPRPTPRPLSESPAFVRAFVERSQMLQEAEREAAAAAAPTPAANQMPTSRADFGPASAEYPDLTPAQTEQIAEAQTPAQRQTTQQAPSTPYIVEPVRIDADRRRLTNEYNRLTQQHRVAVAQRNAAEVFRLQGRADEINEQLRYLNGMTAVTRLRTGDAVPVASALYNESNGRVQLQPNQDGTYNVYLDGQVQNRGVTRDQVEVSARTLFDTRFQQQVQQRQTQNAELALYQAKQRIDAMTRVSADSILKELEAQLKAAAPDTESRIITDREGQQSIVIINKNTGQPIRSVRLVRQPPLPGTTTERLTIEQLPITQ